MLSVVIVAWNEGAVLARCLKSLKTLADDLVVVVDSDTTDDTREIAKKFKARIFEHPHMGIVEPMRDFAISKAKHDWVLVLDADEEISSTLEESIKKIISLGSYDYVKLPRKNIIFNKWIKSSHWWPDYVYRLFKKQNLKWPSEIHSTPIVSGNGYELEAEENNAIVHYNYQSVSQFIDRLNRYTDIQSRELIQKNINYSWINIIQKPTSEFVSQYFSRGGYKDGVHGLALSALQAFSELVVWLKVWQGNDFKEEDIELSSVVNIIRKSSKDFIWWTHEVIIQKSKGLQKPIRKVIRKLTI